MAETYTPDNLVAGDTQLVTDSITVASGQNIVRGAVLGKNTTSGKFVLSLSASSDGSEKAYAIAAADADATSAEVTNVAVYIKGEFNARALTLGAGHTAQTVKNELREIGIYVKDTVEK